MGSLRHWSTEKGRGGANNDAAAINLPRLRTSDAAHINWLTFRTNRSRKATGQCRSHEMPGRGRLVDGEMQRREDHDNSMRGCSTAVVEVS